MAWNETVQAAANADWEAWHNKTQDNGPRDRLIQNAIEEYLYENPQADTLTAVGRVWDEFDRKGEI